MLFILGRISCQDTLLIPLCHTSWTASPLVSTHGAQPPIPCLSYNGLSFVPAISLASSPVFGQPADSWPPRFHPIHHASGWTWYACLYFVSSFEKAPLFPFVSAISYHQPPVISFFHNVICIIYVMFHFLLSLIRCSWTFSIVIIFFSSLNAWYHKFLNNSIYGFIKIVEPPFQNRLPMRQIIIILYIF